MSRLGIRKIISHYLNSNDRHIMLNSPSLQFANAKQLRKQENRSLDGTPRSSVIAQVPATQKVKTPTASKQLQPGVLKQFVLGQRQMSNTNYFADVRQNFNGSHAKLRLSLKAAKEMGATDVRATREAGGTGATTPAKATANTSQLTNPELLQYLSGCCKLCAVCGQQRVSVTTGNNGICAACNARIQGALAAFKQQQSAPTIRLKGACDRCPPPCTCGMRAPPEGFPGAAEKPLYNDGGQEHDTSAAPAAAQPHPFNIIVLQDCNNHNLIDQLTAALTVSCQQQNPVVQHPHPYNSIWQQPSPPYADPQYSNYAPDPQNTYSNNPSYNHSPNGPFMYVANNSIGGSPQLNHSPPNGNISNGLPPQHCQCDPGSTNGQPQHCFCGASSNGGEQSFVYCPNINGQHDEHNRNLSTESSTASAKTAGGEQLNNGGHPTCTCKCEACRIGYEERMKLPQLVAQALEIFVRNHKIEENDKKPLDTKASITSINGDNGKKPFENNEKSKGKHKGKFGDKKNMNAKPKEKFADNSKNRSGEKSKDRTVDKSKAFGKTNDRSAVKETFVDKSKQKFTKQSAEKSGNPPKAGKGKSKKNKGKQNEHKTESLFYLPQSNNCCGKPYCLPCCLPAGSGSCCQRRCNGGNVAVGADGDHPNRVNCARNCGRCISCPNCPGYSRPAPARDIIHPVAHFRPGQLQYPASFMLQRNGDFVRRSLVRTAAGVTVHEVQRAEEEDEDQEYGEEDEVEEPKQQPKQPHQLRFQCPNNYPFWR
ncbi:uncharacterized protein LOC117571313 [Drosophila albomicans]|uniref:Uncharacterized protein LOC117571313 n=1 Tax=Drosophila albomicans TaxID=7291 RepID=A0A6P8XB32_DROAB|nr:uncharacterized protein LOC117571313 [Drosophila albomicans]